MCNFYVQVAVSRPWRMNGDSMASLKAWAASSYVGETHIYRITLCACMHPCTRRPNELWQKPQKNRRCWNSIRMGELREIVQGLIKVLIIELRVVDWEPKNSCDLLHGGICFTAAVWNRTHSILGICLLVQILRRRKPRCFQEMENKPLWVEAESKERGWCHIKQERLVGFCSLSREQRCKGFLEGEGYHMIKF